MVVFPFAKLNIGLQVLRKRADGYHDIRSVLLPVPLRDALEAVVDHGLAAGEVRFESTGIPIPGNPQHNLCLKAVELLAAQHPLPGLRMHLHKAIPTGAGLGGGSSNGAHTLLLLNRLLRLNLPPETLHTLAATLGSDCPFFLRETPQLAEGRGDQLTPIPVDTTGLWLVLINPGIQIPTAEVYGHMRPREAHADLRHLVASPVDTWPDRVTNDMEAYVFDKWPAVASIKQTLLDHGATYASMSGSGSSVYGLFRREPGALPFPETYRSWVFGK